MINIRKKKPAMALIPGSFNSEIPNYQIKFDEKYGEEENLLKKVLIYDLSQGRGNTKVITAKRGEIASEEGSKYMTLILYDGYYYEEHFSKVRSIKEVNKMPASSAHFKEYALNIDISSFSDDDLEQEKFKGSFNMLSLGQLNDTIPILKSNYDEFVLSKSNSIYNKIFAKELSDARDSIVKRKLKPEVIDNFEINEKLNLVNAAINSVKSSINNANAYNKSMKIRRKKLNLYDVEYHNRIAFALSCLILFFIGAPLGSIIRKGGFGLPMILAICIYVIYFFVNTFGRNLAEESSVSAIFGSWISSIVMIPVAFFLTRRASKGMGLFSFSFIKKIFYKEDDVNVADLRVEEKIVISEQDRIIEEKLRPFTDGKLIDFVKNYKQYNYTDGQRQVGLEILAERGISEEELRLKGQFENNQHVEALRYFKIFDKNSKVAIKWYVITFILNFTLVIFSTVFNFPAVMELCCVVVINIVMPLVTYVYTFKSIFNYSRMSKALSEKLDAGTWVVFTIGGMFLYFILYFYIRNEAREKIKSIQ